MELHCFSKIEKPPKKLELLRNVKNFYFHFEVGEESGKLMFASWSSVVCRYRYSTEILSGKNEICFCWI